MDLLSALYYELMRLFPFSITGYDDIDTRISEYFTHFCDHPINIKNNNISFIVGIFGQLTGLEELNTDTIDKINNWETARIKKFLFCNYEGDRAELVMSFYIYQLMSLLPGRYAINILTNNFRNDIDFRISLTDDENPNFFFHRDEKIFEIKVPKSIYSEDLYQNPSEIRNKLREKLQRQLVKDNQDNLLVRYDSINSYELEIIEGNEDFQIKNKELYENKLGSEIFNKSFNQFYQSNLSFLSSEFNTKFVKELIFKNENVQLEELLRIAYAGSFLCAYYDVNLDYILSTCRISGDKTNYKSYGLGGLAVGVKNSTNFSKGNRAFFKIVSNQIASNLSAQITYDLFSIEVYKGKAYKYLMDLWTDKFDLVKLTHFDDTSDISLFSELINGTKSILETFQERKIISKGTHEKAINILNSTTNETWSNNKKEFKELFKLKLKVISTEFIKTNFPSATILDLDTNLNDSLEYHFDFFWIKEILRRIPYSNYMTHVDNSNKKLNIKVIITDEAGEECLNNGGRKHNLIIRFSDNGIGMDLPDSIKNSLNSYSLLQKGKNDYEVLQTHGNIFVHSRGKKLSILDLHKNDSITESCVTIGTTFELVLNAK